VDTAIPTVVPTNVCSNISAYYMSFLEFILSLLFNAFYLMQIINDIAYIDGTMYLIDEFLG